MGLTRWQRMKANSYVVQLWRFIWLNLRILKGVDHSKRS